MESSQEPKSTRSEQSMLKKILDTDYKPANLDEIVGQADNSNQEQKNSLRVLLNKYKESFDGTLGDSSIPLIKLEKKVGAEPVHSKPFSVPHIHRDTICTEIQRMEVLGIL